MCCGLDGLKLDGGEHSQGSLSASAVLGLFGPGEDGDAQLVVGAPAATVEDAFCSTVKKDSMAALSPAAPTRPMDPISWLLASA